MKITFLAVAGLAAASPLVEKRQGGQVCFVFARGSTEPRPLGTIIGTRLESALKQKIPGMRTIPVDYAASLGTNGSAQRTDQASINKGIEAFKKAEGCPKIIAGGYSQGAAVMHNVLGGKGLDEGIKKKVMGVALFGDTRNKQDAGHIPNFPQDRSRVWCNPNDGVCGGGLNVNAGHLSYSGNDIQAAATWLASKVK